MKIIAMLRTFNDEDILQEVIENILAEGLEIVVLDNGSTDRTCEICEKFLNQGVLKITQYQSKYFDNLQSLKMVYDIALTFAPDWMVLIDSDEFLESGLKNTTVKEIIIRADKEGYNLIQFNWFDFFFTDNDNESAKSVKERMKYYSFQGDILYRSWKYIPGIFWGSHNGHIPIFPYQERYKIYPKKLVLRHYTFRNAEHAKRKTALRIRGTNEGAKDIWAIGAHTRKVLSQDYSAKADHQLLTEYKEDGSWDFQIKHNPFSIRIPPKREDIFTDDGMLKKREKSIREYQNIIKNKNQRIKNLRERNQDIIKRNKELRERNQSIVKKNDELRTQLNKENDQ